MKVASLANQVSSGCEIHAFADKTERTYSFVLKPGDALLKRLYDHTFIVKMKPTFQDRILKREIGDSSRYANVRGLYGDRAWIDDLDIVAELSGHSGCVNALR